MALVLAAPWSRHLPPFLILAAVRALGVSSIPLLRRWYFGQDINPDTVAFGEEVLREAGFPSRRTTRFASDQLISKS